MDILLIAMPWHTLDAPSVSIGILTALTDRLGDGVNVDQLYANVSWAEYLMAIDPDRFSPVAYTEIAERGLFVGIGDWIFALALYGRLPQPAEDYHNFLRAKGFDPGLADEMQSHATAYVTQLSDDIANAGYDLVGFSTTFMQNVPSLAVARQLKLKAPGTKIVFGGGNCEGEQGVALHRNHRYIDYVVRGEGERPYIELVSHLRSGRSLDRIGGLCYWVGDESVSSPPEAEPMPMGDVPTPDYGAYFERIENSPVRPYVEPKIILEAARGCWWGEKHHCTFCGLNGATMKFRSKDPAVVFDELISMAHKHQTLDVVMVDNIMDQEYFGTLLPRLTEADFNFRIHYEVKSNLTASDVFTLKRAGIVHAQPGIENLSSSVLKIMDKGVNSVHNVRTLRECAQNGMTVSWNYLYGFPGEAVNDYATAIRQFGLLHHLHPPLAATRIALERFSPYFDRPDLGFLFRQPAAFYSMIYDLPKRELRDLVYLFDTTTRGLTEEEAADLQAAIERWQAAFLVSELTWREDAGGCIAITDARPEVMSGSTVLDDQLQCRVFKSLLDGGTASSVQRKLRDLDPALAEVEQAIDELSHRGLVYSDGPSHVALPTAATRAYAKLKSS